MSKGFFLTGIGTGIGKTIAAAALCQALEYDYWKPLQAGNLENSDSMLVQRLISNNVSKVHDEKHKLNTACSPHQAAAIDGISLRLSDFALPKTDKPLIVEGAGGLLVPLNEENTLLDLIGHFALPVILVTKNYLGSINHTLLSIQALRSRGYEIALLLFNGERNYESERIIIKMADINNAAYLPPLPTIDPECLIKAAAQIKDELKFI